MPMHMHVASELKLPEKCLICRSAECMLFKASRRISAMVIAIYLLACTSDAKLTFHMLEHAGICQHLDVHCCRVSDTIEVRTVSAQAKHSEGKPHCYHCMLMAAPLYEKHSKSVADHQKCGLLPGFVGKVLASSLKHTGDGIAYKWKPHVVYTPALCSV